MWWVVTKTTLPTTQAEGVDVEGIGGHTWNGSGNHVYKTTGGYTDIIRSHIHTGNLHLWAKESKFPDFIPSLCNN